MEQQKTNKKETKIPKLKMIPGLEIFDRHDFLNGRGLYVSLFGKIPNLFEISHINTEDFTIFFKEKYSEAILKEYCYKTNIKKDKEEYEDAAYLLKGELLLQINSQNYLEIYSQAQSLNDLSELFEDIKKFRRKKRKAKNEISLIVPCHGSLGTERVKFKKPKINLEENYNDDFLEIHQNVVQQLNKKQESGLVLFHGKPGTGKSTYLRYLVKKLKKDVIFVSPKTAGSLDNLEITKLLLDNKNTVLIVEDAEELIVSRNNERNSNLSTLLNITDGILGECLGIQIIATFNTDVQNIDKALLRKGRLKISYEFEELSVEKTNKLLEQQGIEAVVNQPMNLADIFNFTNNDGYNQPLRKAVGFRN